MQISKRLQSRDMRMLLLVAAIERLMSSEIQPRDLQLNSQVSVVASSSEGSGKETQIASLTCEFAM